MSVFTALDQTEVSQLLQQYTLGELQNYAGVHGGITNTIYKLKTEQGEFLLTLFEELTAEQLPSFLQLLDFFAHQDIPCSQPIKNKKEEWIARIKQKPVVLMNYLPGEVIENVEPEHCRQLGELLGLLHLKGMQFSNVIPNTRSADWRETTANKLYPVLESDDAALLKQEMLFQLAQDYGELPKGIIHMDLFRDNVLFQHNQLSGVIDFFYACTDMLLLDVAICVLDWCRTESGDLNQENHDALIQAYQQIRSLTTAEEQAWAAVLRLATLRFWLSRLHDFYFPAKGEDVLVKDPNEFRPREL